MTVAELTEILNALPDRMVVVMSSDEEGNTISPVSEADVSKWDDTHKYAVHPDDLDGTESEVLILWPGWWPR